MVAVTPHSSTVDTVAQSVYLVEKSNTRALLTRLLADDTIKRALVFTRTKHGANRVAEYLARAGVHADAIHGNKSQNARERALVRFKRGESRVLVATDIAARGIDIDDVSHVVNFDLPNVPETYVHRIGRTGRAGASGMAISFCELEERPYLADIERLIARKVPRVEDHPFRPSWAAEPLRQPIAVAAPPPNSRPGARPNGDAQKRPGRRRRRRGPVRGRPLA
jgi:ATP-dependent RNA helicase RhlE